MERYRPLVMAVARRMGLQDADAQDAAQETMVAFIRAYRDGRYDREKGRLRTWLRGIAVHKIHDLVRGRQRADRALREGASPAAAARQADADADALWSEEWDHAVLRQCLDEVRREVQPRTFEAFTLFALQEWPVAEVARHLRVSEETVYQAKSRIMKRIRDLMPAMEEDW
jgi:RNA polymerase sigma-70 factor (ECF subfamily)